MSNDILHKTSPLVSFLMTVYNGMPYLKSSIESILSQTYKNLELVVVDDGSKDDSLAFLKSINDPRLRLIEGGRLGRGKALNLGLSHCNGKYIAINDSDDISLPNRLNLQVQFMEENPDHVLVGTFSYLFNLDSGEKKLHNTRPLNDYEIKKALTKHQPIQHVTTMIRRDAILKVDGYNEKIKFLFDRDLFVKLGTIGKMANLDIPLVEVGHHNNRFFYFTFKGFERELLSLKYRIKAIKNYNFPKIWILREIVRSAWTLIPNNIRQVIIKGKKKVLG